MAAPNPFSPHGSSTTTGAPPSAILLLVLLSTTLPTPYRALTVPPNAAVARNRPTFANRPVVGFGRFPDSGDARRGLGAVTLPAKTRSDREAGGGGSVSSRPFRRPLGGLFRRRVTTNRPNLAAAADDDGAEDTSPPTSEEDSSPPSPPSPSVDDATTAAKDDDSDEGIGAWIPIASANSLRGLGPQRVTVMGIDLVVWENDDDSGNGKWSVMADVCPHRLAPLSQGRVDPETGCLECPYHGWQFDADGNVTKIPQLEEGKDLTSVGENANAQSLPVHAAGDLICAFLPSSVHGEMFRQSTLPEEMFPGLAEEVASGMNYLVRELPYSADFVIENFMDPAHIPFAHHKLQSVREDGSPIAMELLVSNFTHVEVTFKDVSRGKARDGVVSFQRPSFYHFRTRKNDDSDSWTRNLCIHVVPVRAGHSRVFMKEFPIPWLPAWLKHAASNRFLNTDTWLHDAERTARKDGTKSLKYVYASESDKGVNYFRRWWSRHGLASSPPNTFGPASIAELGPRALTRAEQIDPWVHHSKQCATCRRALKHIKRGEVGGLALAVAGALFSRGRPVVGVVVAAAGIFTNVMCRKTATIIEGNPYPSGIGDRSVAADAP